MATLPAAPAVAPAPFGRGDGLPSAPGSLLAWLESSRDWLVPLWVSVVSGLGPHYRRREPRELDHTIGHSYEANLRAMVHGRVRPLDRFVAYITRLRLQAGFPLSEVQQAFDQYRVLLWPRLLTELPAADHASALMAVHACVSYQIHRFSDQFQAMHEAAIRRRADHLAAEVASRGRRLALSEGRYKTLVEEISDGYFVIQEQRIVFANQAFARLHAASPAQVVGRAGRVQPGEGLVGEDDALLLDDEIAVADLLHQGLVAPFA